MRDMLIARPLHALVRAPRGFKTQLAFFLPATESAAKRFHSSGQEPSPMPLTHFAARRTIITTLGRFVAFQKRGDARTMYYAADPRRNTGFGGIMRLR
jgi:hypothetical protein